MSLLATRSKQSLVGAGLRETQLSGLPELPGARHRCVDLGEVRLHVAELGPPDAPPLLLVHGWPQHWWCWRHVAPALARDHLCLMPDLRGHGWSQVTEGGYEKRQLATDLLDLLDSLGIARVGMLGHDWGGFIGWHLACGWPERLRALLALSIPHPWPKATELLNPLRWAGFAYQLPLSAPIAGPAMMRHGLTKRAISASARRSLSDEDLEIYDARLRTEGGARATQQLYRTFLLRELAWIRRDFGQAETLVPIHLAAGEKDPVAKHSDLGGYQQHAPRMTAELIPEAGHFLPEECPALVIDRARQLFERADSG